MTNQELADATAQVIWQGRAGQWMSTERWNPAELWEHAGIVLEWLETKVTQVMTRDGKALLALKSESRWVTVPCKGIPLRRFICLAAIEVGRG